MIHSLEFALLCFHTPSTAIKQNTGLRIRRIDNGLVKQYGKVRKYFTMFNSQNTLPYLGINKVLSYLILRKEKEDQ